MFIITALIVGAIIGAYIGGSQANGTYNPFKWDFNNVDTWIGMVGGATGALTTPKGHNILDRTRNTTAYSNLRRSSHKYSFRC